MDKRDIHVYVIGEHGDSEVTAWSSAFVGSVSLNEFLLPEITSLEKLKEEYAELTRQRAYAISERKGSTNYGIATVVAQLVEAILRDEKQIFPVSVRADSRYGIGDQVVLGLPCIIGKQGIERQIVLPRNTEEQRLLEESASHLDEAYNSLPN